MRKHQEDKRSKSADLIDPKVLREKTEEIIRIIEEIPKADEIVAMLEKVHGVKA